MRFFYQSFFGEALYDPYVLDEAICHGSSGFTNPNPRKIPLFIHELAQPPKLSLEGGNFALNFPIVKPDDRPISPTVTINHEIMDLLPHIVVGLDKSDQLF